MPSVSSAPYSRVYLHFITVKLFCTESAGKFTLTTYNEYPSLCTTFVLTSFHLGNRYFFFNHQHVKEPLAVYKGIEPLSDE